MHLPWTAAWRHVGARTGFEVAYFELPGDGCRIRGTATGVESSDTWIVSYDLTIDDNWCARRAEVNSRSFSGIRTAVLEGDGTGRWLVDGHRRPDLDGCLDIDLEASAVTNAMPTHRLALQIGEHSPAPAVYVRATDASAERLEQTYTRLDDTASGSSYDYAAPAFDFSCVLTYDRSGLVLDYPGIAIREL